MSTLFKKERRRYSIDPDSRMLPIYQFYVNMGGQYQRQLDRCTLLKVVIFKAPWYFISRKKIVADLTLLHLALCTYLLGMVGLLLIKAPQFTLSVAAGLTLLYLFRHNLFSRLEKIYKFYTKNESYTIRTLKILATIGIIFGVSSYFFGVDVTWEALKSILIGSGIGLVVLAVFAGVIILIITISDWFKAMGRARRRKLEVLANLDPLGKPTVPEVQHDSILTMAWDHLVNFKNIYFCPLVDIPDGAIEPRNVSYS